MPKAIDEMLRARILRAAEPAILTRDPVAGQSARDLAVALTARLDAVPADPIATVRADVAAARAEANALVAGVQRLTAELVIVRKLAAEARTEARAAEGAAAGANEHAAALAARLAKLTTKGD